MVPLGNSALLTRSDRRRLKRKMNVEFYKEKTVFPQFRKKIGVPTGIINTDFVTRCLDI